MATAYKYGTGTPTQFTTGEQRQVLELGQKIHMFNPDVTPIFTVMGRTSTMVTPVPIFEWMEDEFFIRPDVITTVKAADIIVGTTGDNDTGFIIKMNRQAQVEGFEKGALYLASGMAASGAVAYEGAASDVYLMCVAIGKEVSTANVNHADHKNVQFVESDGVLPAFKYDKNATTVVGFAHTADTAITFTYQGNVGEMSTLAKPGYAATSTNLTDDETATVYQSRDGWAEGANIGEMTSKKVRRLKGCTQIFREPFSITGTQDAAKMYGGNELSRLQARKLNKIKMDIEYAMLTNGAIALDDTSENPKRKMEGLGVGTDSLGAIKSLNGYSNTDLQFDISDNSLDDLDKITEAVFKDSLSGSMRKSAFVSNKWLKQIVSATRNDSATNLVAEMGSNATAGLRVTTYYGPIGELEFITHPLLNNSLEDYGVIIDFGNVNSRPLRTRDMQLRTNVIQDGRDGQTNEWLCETGMEIRNEQTHAIIKLVP